MLKPLRIDIGRSHWLLCYLYFVHALALMGAMQLSLYPALIVIVCVIASLIYCIYRYCAGDQRNAVTALELGAGYGYLVFRDGKWKSINLSGQQFVSNRLIILGYRQRGEAITKHLVLFADGVDANIFRRLKVMLRFPESRD